LKTLTGKLFNRNVFLNLLFVCSAFACVNYITVNFWPWQYLSISFVMAYAIAITPIWNGLMPSRVSRAWFCAKEDVFNFFVMAVCLYLPYYIYFSATGSRAGYLLTPLLLALGLSVSIRLLSFATKR